MKQGKNLYFLLLQKTITRISLHDIRMVKYKKTKGIDDYHCPAGPGHTSTGAGINTP
jgi:hypothetical protein